MDIDVKKIITGNWGYVVADYTHFGIVGVLAWGTDSLYSPYCIKHGVPLSRWAVIPIAKVEDVADWVENDDWFYLVERAIDRPIKVESVGEAAKLTAQQKWASIL